MTMLIKVYFALFELKYVEKEKKRKKKRLATHRL